MTDETTETSQTWKAQYLAIGGLLGALIGLAAAYLLVQRAEKDGGKPRLSTGEGVKLGVLAFTTLRQVVELGEKGKK